MRSVSMRVFLALVLLAATIPMFAATYLVPPDREMIQRSDDIVVAVAVTSLVERTPSGGIVTRYVLRIEEVLKGDRTCGSYLTLREIGGDLPDLGLYVSGMPVYVPGGRYLVFAETRLDGDSQTWGLELGQFALQKDGDQLLAFRSSSGIDQHNLEPYRENARDAVRFIEYIRDIVAQRTNPAPSYFVAVPQGISYPKLIENFTRRSYLLTNGFPRWQSAPNASVRTALTPQGANGVAAATSAIGAWNGAGGSNINYSYFGQDDTAKNGFEHCSDGASCPNGMAHDGKNTILYDDPFGEVSPPVLGRGGFWMTGATYLLDGENFRAIDGGIDVVIDNITWSQCLLNVVVLHEAGHTFGFRHANQNGDSGTNPPPCNGATQECTSAAIMNSSVSCSLTALQTYDRNAAATVYGSGPTCTPPSITTHPQNVTITQGNSTTLTVVATGTTPLTYQWYIGTSPDTSSPTGTNSSSLNVSPTSTTSYWVRVTGQCAPAADSRTATVTVNPATCTPPNITAHPENVTITQGNSTLLSVTATGTAPLIYQWYIGQSGDQSTPTGANSPQLLVSPAATTSYWVRVTGQCAPSANSRTATVTVNSGPCTPPTINTNPQNVSITQGNSTTLSVSAAGTSPLIYQWYIGQSGDQSMPTGANSPQLLVSPAVTTSYWVRVTGQCAPSANSSTATVTVNPNTCPDVMVQTPTAVKQPDNSYLLDVVASSGGGALNYQWFEGPVPGTGTLVGTSRPQPVPAPTAPISYWVRVSNNCGKNANSPNVVTIAPCDLPMIVTEPGDQSIVSGASATLTFTFTSVTPATVRWYRGIAPDKTNEAGVGTSFNTGPLTATTQYWASITNTCGEKFTRTLTVTVGTACTAPQITSTSPPQTKLKNETVTLNVVATGTPALQYQWYEGLQGDISNPVGIDSATFTSGPLTQTTRFWVKVTNACGSAFSSAIQVTVLKPRSRAVRH